MNFTENNDLPEKSSPENSAEKFRHWAQQGLLKHAIAEEFHGSGGTFSDLISAHEKLGFNCRDTGLVLSLNAHLWGAVFPILNFGNPEQKKLWLSDLLSGTLIAGHAITEPQAGSDLNGLKMEATKKGNNLILNGRKRFITNTPIADFLVVYARMENKLSAFIVCRQDPGARFQNQPVVEACATATMGDLVLENCVIPNHRQLGKTGAGNMLIQQALELERAFIFAGISGVMAWQLDSTVQFSRERIVNNGHLGQQQAISHKIADMKLRLETIRLWVKECARLKDTGLRLTLASAQTKLYASEAFLQSSLDAVQISGSNGLLKNSPHHKLVNDAMASRLFSGSSEIQKNIIAALLGTGAGYKSQRR